MIGWLGDGGVYDAMFAVVMTVSALGFFCDRLYLMLMHRVLAMARMTDDARRAPAGVGRRSTACAGSAAGSRAALPLILILAAWEGVRPQRRVSARFCCRRFRSCWSACGTTRRRAIWRSIWRRRSTASAVGFAISAVLGVVLGILIARSRATRWFFDPIISVAFPMPKIAFLPVFMLWFGLYDASKITMIVFSAIFPVVTATVTSTSGVEKELLWSARSLGASERRLLWEIILPAALPQILTGLQVALPVSMIVAVVTEILMGGAGIGGAMIQASRFADLPGVFAGIIEIALAGYCFVKGISWSPPPFACGTRKRASRARFESVQALGGRQEGQARDQHDAQSNGQAQRLRLDLLTD